MPSLRKYCQSIHNLADTCRTIQLGTLEHYAKADSNDAPFADPNEGLRIIIGKDISQSVTTLSQLDARLTGNGRLTAKLMNFNRNEINCYVFSCSLEDGKFTGYDSSYLLPEANVIEHILLELLAAQLTSKNVVKPDPSGRHIIKCEHGKVKYFNRDAFMFDNKSIQKLIAKNKCPPCFSKFKEYNGKNYEIEKEYRFCFFVFNLEGTQIPVKKEPVILQDTTYLEKIAPLHPLCTKD